MSEDLPAPVLLRGPADDKEATVIGSFVLGAIVGGAAVWLYGPQIRAFVEDRTRTARGRAAGTLQAASEGLQAAKEKLEGERGIGGL